MAAWKTKFSTKKRGSRDGSVLMETVVAIPLFLVLIGGTLWLSDLGRSHSRGLAMDRYAAWNAGNRLGGASVTPDALSERFYESNPDQRVTRVTARSRGSGWYREVKGQAHTLVSMPAWTRGLMKAGVTWDARPVRSRERITGRDRPHLIVMRGGSRDQEKSAVNWMGAATEPWWPRTRGGGLSPNLAMTPSYTRHGRYEQDWSL